MKGTMLRMSCITINNKGISVSSCIGVKANFLSYEFTSNNVKFHVLLILRSNNSLWLTTIDWINVV